MLLSENSKISTPSVYTVFSWTLLLELWNPWRQQVASIHTVFTQDLELHLPMEGELLWPFCTISQGQCILRGQLGAVFPPLPCYYAVSMAEGLTSIVLPVPVWYQHTWMYQHPWGGPSSAFSFATFLAVWAVNWFSWWAGGKQETSFRWSTPWPPFSTDYQAYMV